MKHEDWSSALEGQFPRWAKYGVRLDDEQWEVLLDALPGKIGTRMRNDEEAYRQFVEAVLWTVETHAFWIDLPAEYGSSRATYVRFIRWQGKGLWDVLARVVGRDTLLACALMSRVREHASRATRLRMKREGSLAMRSSNRVARSRDAKLSLNCQQ